MSCDDGSCAAQFRWCPDYAIGVAEIDSDHQHIFGLLDGFRVAVQKGHGTECLIRLLDEVVGYTSHHFAHEELLMEQIGYPYKGEHQLEHENLRRRLFKMRGQAASGDPAIVNQIFRFFMRWLRYHTTTSDRRIGTYMRKHDMVA
jgi:hemerythrin